MTHGTLSEPILREPVLRKDTLREYVAVRRWVDLPPGAAERLPRTAAPRALPRIRREGIQWTGGFGGAPLEIRLTFENPAPLATRPAPAQIRIAEFGAFLPWRELTRVVVPAIEPRGRTVVTAMAAAPRPERVRRAASLRPLGRWGLFSLQAGVDPNARLAINLDVRVGGEHPVERHFGTFACLRSGYANVVFFKVGDGQRDTYTFTVTECPEGGDVRLATPGITADLAKLHHGVSAEMSYMLVRSVVTLPSEVRQGRVAFGVERASLRQRTTVELDLVGATP